MKCPMRILSLLLPLLYIFPICYPCPILQLPADALCPSLNLANGSAISTPAVSNFTRSPVNPSSDQTKYEIDYRVPGTDMVLGLHSFQFDIPIVKAKRALGSAVAVVSEEAKTSGQRPIPLGFFRYAHCFRDDSMLVVTVADFREIGKPPLTYNYLVQAFGGLLNWMNAAKRYTTVQFEIANMTSNIYVGSGSVQYQGTGDSILLDVLR